MPLPPPPPAFTTKKSKILSDISVPDAEYTDLSPKGTIDLALRPLIHEINAVPGFVTTSSCAGRASVFLAGSSRTARPPVQGGEATVASAGGKGGGGRWLYVSHGAFGEGAPRRCLDNEDGEGGRGEICGSWGEAFGVGGGGREGEKGDEGDEGDGVGDGEKRLIHFKFEPMILHVLTASLQHAQLLLRCAQTSGFRESGVTNVATLHSHPNTSLSSNPDLNLNPNLSLNPNPTPSNHPNPASPSDPLPIVAIRTAGLAFESLIGLQLGPSRTCIVSEDYFSTLVEVANARFVENQKRIDRFGEAFRDAAAKFGLGTEEGGDGGDDGTHARKLGSGKKGLDWEDSRLRKERKRAEGLRRREELMRSMGQKDQKDQPRQQEPGQQPSSEQENARVVDGQLEECGDAEADTVGMISNLGL